MLLKARPAPFPSTVMLTDSQTWGCSLYRFWFHGWCLWLATLVLFHGYVQYCVIGCFPKITAHADIAFQSGLDSYQYPVKSYGDLAFRLYGQSARYVFNILQSIQLICAVALIIISNGEALSEVSKFKLCYAICCLVWALAGFLIGQVRTLQKFGWLANFAVWINLLIMFISMGVAAHSPPLYSAAAASAGYSVNPALVTANAAGVFPAVTHSAGLPDPANFGASVNGLMQAVYAYGGAMLFTEFMSEMKRPYDFLKGMWGAQFFIYISVTCSTAYSCTDTKASTCKTHLISASHLTTGKPLATFWLWSAL